LDHNAAPSYRVRQKFSGSNVKKIYLSVNPSTGKVRVLGHDEGHELADGFFGGQVPEKFRSS
jgi:hypothetical protein